MNNWKKVCSIHLSNETSKMLLKNDKEHVNNIKTIFEVVSNMQEDIKNRVDKNCKKKK